MGLIAIVAWLCYFAVAFVYRTHVQLRTTGRTGFVGFGAHASGVERFAGALFVLSLMAGFVAPLLGLLAPAHGLAHTLEGSAFLTVLAGVLYAIGLTATLAAQLAMGKSWRIGVAAHERTELVVRGPFVWVRNPIFTAMGITALGLVGLFPSWLAVGACAALMVALELQVRLVEEPYLRRTHGDAYLHYARRTGRFVPGLGLMRT